MNKNRKINKKRIGAAVLAGTITLGQLGMTVQAAEKPSNKEEVVYAMLDSDGGVAGVYVVNIFSGESNIVDYGDYTSVRNMTTTDSISQNANEISISTDADKLYYQGNLETKEIPWNFKIQYFIDGKEYDASEIAGMSGELKLIIDITQNEKCDESFWEGYALQASMTLDTNKCKNIQAEGATIANVGADKQLSYIILPGKGKSIEITADVTDFEMDEISVNGVKLNLNMEVDTSDLTEKITEIQDAVSELNDGAGSLNDGTSELSDGAKDIYDGSVTLSDGASDANDGMEQLQTGIAAMQTALGTLDSKSAALTSGSTEVMSALKTIQSSLSSVSVNAEDVEKLTDASSQIKKGIDSLVAGMNTIDASIDTYYSTLNAQLMASGVTSVSDLANKNTQAAQALGITNTQRALYAAYVQDGTAGVQAKLTELVTDGDADAIALYQKVLGGDTNAVTEYVNNAGTLISVESLLIADSSYITGSDAVISGISGQLDTENGDLMKGALALQSNYASFDSTIQSLGTSLNAMATNIGKLKTGIDTLVTNYSTLDSGITEYTEAVGKIVEAYQDIYDGAVALTEGTGNLYNGTKSLVEGTQAFYEGALKLEEGTEELLEGTNEFYDKIKDMDSEVDDTIQDTLDTLTGSDVPVISFVSDKNTNVSSVLFVLKTPAIEKAEEITTEVEEEEKLNFFEKFLALFGV